MNSVVRGTFPGGAPERVDAIVRTTCAIPEAKLRVAYFSSLLADGPIEELAVVLDALCARAEQADLPAREALVALVDAIAQPECAAALQRLREEAVGVPHLALERIVRSPVSLHPSRDVPSPEEDRVPDYGRGRPLSLGERKSLARGTDRDMLERLLRDPHPDVIRQLLSNPKLTEDDVLRLAARRPCRPDVLLEIVRAPRWSHRARIRMSLVMNPDTPLTIAAPILGLLMRHELRLVATSPTVATAVRALANEHLERKPPGSGGEPDGDLQ